MTDALFPVTLVVLGILCQGVAVAFRRRRFSPLLLLSGAALIIAFAVWEHDAVLLLGQAIAAAALAMLIKPRKAR